MNMGGGLNVRRALGWRLVAVHRYIGRNMDQAFL